MTKQQIGILIIIVCVGLNIFAYIIDRRAGLLMSLATAIDKIGAKKLFGSSQE